MIEEVLRKLRYKEGQAAVINAPDGYQLGLGSALEAGKQYDFVLLFVNSAAETDDLFLKIIPSLKEEALFWVSYPKQSGKFKPDINRDSLWKLVENKSSYRPVTNVAIDEKWSALRFRHKDKVKSKK